MASTRAMWARRATLTVASLAALAAWHPSPALAQPLELNDTGFDSFVEQTRQDYAVPGAFVVIVRPGRVVLSKGYGVRRAGAPGPMDGDTRFQLASLSKFLTATAVARLVDRGTVSWDAPVQSFSPETVLSVPYATDHATLRDYFAHRTGLPAYGGDLLNQLGYPADEIVRRARYFPFGQSFREKWAYSNYGIFLGEAAAAHAAGMSPPAMLSETLLQPLGMTRSGPTLATLTGDEDRAAAHDTNGAVMPNEDVDGFSGAGAIVSTGNDLGRWMRMMLGGGMLDGQRLLTKDAVQAVFAPSMVQGPGGPLHDPNDAAGLGCESYQFLGTRVIEKNGALNGVRTIVTLIPDRGIGIAVFANKQLTVFPEAVRAEFLERLLGRSGQDLQAQVRAEQPAWDALLHVPAAPANAAPPTHALEAFTGNFTSPVFGTVAVQRQGDALEARFGPARYEGHLSHWDGDTFLLTFDNPDTAPGLLRFEFAAGPSAARIVGQGIPGTLVLDHGVFGRLRADGPDVGPARQPSP